MQAPDYTRVTSVDGTAELRSPRGTQRRSGEFLVVDDDQGGVRVVTAGTSAGCDLEIAGARRVGHALLWRNDRGATLAVVGTTRPVLDEAAELEGRTASRP